MSRQTLNQTFNRAAEVWGLAIPMNMYDQGYTRYRYASCNSLTDEPVSHRINKTTNYARAVYAVSQWGIGCD